MAERYETPPEYPVRLHIQTISYCNAHCLFCAYPAVADTISHGIMEDAVYKKIIDEASEYQPKRISLLLMNEPLLDRKLPERIAYAKEKLGEETEVTITSNGSVLTPKIIGRLIDSGLDRIKISIQGITRDTYERVMGLNYDRTFKGINLLVDTLKERRASRPGVVLPWSMWVTTKMRSESISSTGGEKASRPLPSPLKTKAVILKRISSCIPSAWRRRAGATGLTAVPISFTTETSYPAARTGHERWCWETLRKKPCVTSGTVRS